MNRGFVFLFIIFLGSWSPAEAEVNYSSSAHADSSYGVQRTGLGHYAQGNCAHCHEQHASVENDQAQNFLVFSQTDPTNTAPYSESENFCFQCHASLVVNYDYSTVFGGHQEASGSGGASPESILEAFNKAHSHDLDDIYNHAINHPDQFPWFTEASNPCTACHNPHLARRNHENPDNPVLSVMSLPDEHLSLYGDGDGDGDSSDGDEGSAISERMNKWSAAPVYISPNNEPAPVDTPDYNTFCLYCHSAPVAISNDDRPYYHGGTVGQLLAIDWEDNGGDGVQSGTYIVPGDKHGYNTATSYAAVEAPFNIYGTSNVPGDVMLSCTNCHEPHGSENDYMHRRWINNTALGVVITGVTNEAGAHCVPCHTEDPDGGWKQTHHGADVVDGEVLFQNDNPYVANAHGGCTYCHGATQRSDPDFPIPCEDCHFHGSYVDENDKYTAAGQAAGVKYVKPDKSPYRRKTF